MLHLEANGANFLFIHLPKAERSLEETAVSAPGDLRLQLSIDNTNVKASIELQRHRRLPDWMEISIAKQSSNPDDNPGATNSQALIDVNARP